MTAMNPDKDIIIDILKNLRLFRDLNYNAIKELTFLFSERVFQAGETIFAENDTDNSLQVIISGDVRITQRANVSGEETLTVLKKGDFFGEMALLEEMPRTATAFALEETKVFMLFKIKLESLFFSRPQIGVTIAAQLAKIMSARLRAIIEKPE